MADNSSRLVCLNTCEGRERLQLAIATEDATSTKVNQDSIDGRTISAFNSSGVSRIQKTVESSWRVQRTKTTCGVASLAIVLSSVEPNTSLKVEEEHIFPMARTIKNLGISKPQVGNISHTKGNVTSRSSTNTGEFTDNSVDPLRYTIDTTVPVEDVKENLLSDMTSTRPSNIPKRLQPHTSTSNSRTILQNLQHLETKVMQCGMTLIEIASLARHLPGVERVVRWHSRLHSYVDGDGDEGNNLDGDVGIATATSSQATPVNTHSNTDTPTTGVEDCNTLNHFRSLIVTSLGDTCVRLVLNYHMTTLGQPPYGGHFSPIAGYHGPTDSILIMDTWYDTTPVWAPLKTVWLATLGLDSETQLARGILQLTF